MSRGGELSFPKCETGGGGLMPESRTRLVCNTLAMGHDLPSHRRYCGDCGTGVWVSANMTPTVDFGTTVPICVGCWTGHDDRSGGGYSLDPRQMRDLAEAGVLDFAYQFIRNMNEKGKPV